MSKFVISKEAAGNTRVVLLRIISAMSNCSADKTGRRLLVNIDHSRGEGNISRRRASIAIHERPRRPPQGARLFHPAGRIISEDAVSNCILLLRGENRSSFRHPDYSHPVALGRYPARALPPYLTLEIGLSVICAHRAADALSRPTVLIFPRFVEAPALRRAIAITCRQPVAGFLRLHIWDTRKRR